MKINADFSDLNAAANMMLPQSTVHDLHSSTLEIFLLTIEKQMDIENANADANHFIASAVDATLVRLYNNVRSAQVSAIERETGA
jgi:hypothetical protein